MSTDDIWAPRVTVAAIVERDGRFLLIEEETGAGLRLNQPAGHLDPGESLLTAVSREALEETAYEFVPETVVGIYHHVVAPSGLTYLRFAFAGRLGRLHADRSLDHGIVRTLWMTREEVHASAARHRTPLVQRCIEDYCAGRRFPLEVLQGGPQSTP